MIMFDNKGLIGGAQAAQANFHEHDRISNDPDAVN
jgi:hypothetical protein